MKQEILAELNMIQQKENVKILYAVESGSRGWGFESKDSDWDVRFFYIHEPNWYLSIEDKRDTLEYPINGDLDLSGWELRKTLNLFRKSNPPLLEWLRCPIIYLEQFTTAQKLRDLIATYFSPKSCMYHYLHMAIGNYREYLKGDSVRVKKYFYVLRPILACKWIENNDTMAPMEFQRLLDTQLDNPKLKAEIDKLKMRKMDGEELDVEPRIGIINDFLEERIAYYEKYVEQYNSKKEPDIEKLNLLFRETLNEVWSNASATIG